MNIQNPMSLIKRKIMGPSKIRELEAVLGSGARNNKYRVIFPYFGREIDIQTHDVTAPGRSMGVAEVYLKGRKYQLAGDRSDEGTITLTFYNDPEMIIRRFFFTGYCWHTKF